MQAAGNHACLERQPAAAGARLLLAHLLLHRLAKTWGQSARLLVGAFVCCPAVQHLHALVHIDSPPLAATRTASRCCRRRPGAAAASCGVGCICGHGSAHAAAWRVPQGAARAQGAEQSASRCVMSRAALATSEIYPQANRGADECACTTDGARPKLISCDIPPSMTGAV